MAFKDTGLNVKINSFLDKANHGNALGLTEKLDLQELLIEPDPPNYAVREELTNQRMRLIAWLGITRRTSDGGEAGKIDNLMVLINSFILLFCIAALAPVMFIYRTKTWIIPVLLICPIIHLIACRLARNPGVEISRIKSMHLFAAVFSIVPLACLAYYLNDCFDFSGNRSILWGAVGGLWIVYTILVAALIRTESGFYWSLFIVGIGANYLMIRLRMDFVGAVSMNLLIGTLMLFLAGMSRKDGLAMPAGRLSMVAAFFVGLAFGMLAYFLVHFGRYGAHARFIVALPLYAVALAFLPSVIKAEAARLAGDKWKKGCLTLLAVTWLYFGLALLFGWIVGEYFSVNSLRALVYARVFLGAALAVVLAWSLWFLYEQFVADKDFDINVFSSAALLLILCLVTGFVLLIRNVGYVAALLLAIAVFALNLKLWARHSYGRKPAAAIAQQKESADPGEPESDA